MSTRGKREKRKYAPDKHRTTSESKSTTYRTYVSMQHEEENITY